MLGQSCGIVNFNNAERVFNDQTNVVQNVYFDNQENAQTLTVTGWFKVDQTDNFNHNLFNVKKIDVTNEDDQKSTFSDVAKLFFNA